ncbi:MAG: amidohydrolase [bacterium]
MKTYFVVQLFCLGVFMMAVSCSRQMADLVFKNGTIYTVDDNMSQVQAVAVAGTKILAVGTDEDIEKLVGANTRVIDLEGKTMTPGLIDSHYHFMGVGQREFHLNLDGTTSLQDFLSKVKAEVAKKADGEWIIGRGWIEEDWPSKRFPTRHDLDKVAPNNPAMLRRADGHAAVVNSKALEIAGITKTTADPQGGKILRDQYSGEATGLLIDRAMSLVGKYVPSDDSPDIRRQYAQKANDVALAYGLTQVHDMGSSFETVDLWKNMYENDELKIRLHVCIRGPSEDSDRLLNQGAEIGLYDNKLNVRSIKISADGALGSRGARLLEPYNDADTKGLLIFKDEEIYPTIEKAAKNGIQMMIHAIGDGANRKVLDLYEQAFSAVPVEQRVVAEPRFRIEHSQIVHLDDIPRFKELGVIPSMQPSHAIGDLHFAIRRLGLSRMPEAYAWRPFIDQGSYIPGGSDAPVEEGNPMIEFYAACVRKDTTGFTAEGWHPEYKMAREEALKSMTIWGAKAAFMEDLIGSIEPGKYADLVVLDRNLMTEPEERLFDIKVQMTVVAGEIVYEKGEVLSNKK